MSVKLPVVNFSTSSLTEYQRCPREWYWGHGYRREEPVLCPDCTVALGGQINLECKRCGGVGRIPARGGIESV